MTTTPTPVLSPSVASRLAKLRAERESIEADRAVQRRLAAVNKLARVAAILKAALGPCFEDVAYEVADRSTDYWADVTFTEIGLHFAGLPVIYAHIDLDLDKISFDLNFEEPGYTTFDDALLAAAEVAGVQG